MIGTFEPTYSTNNIWWDENMNECLTPRIEGIETDIAALETGKADATHTHSNYAATTHTHSEYANSTHTHSEYAIANHEHDDYAAEDHEHDGYALATHSHTLADLGFQYGKVTVQCTANTVSTANVTFDKEYQTAPVVTLTAGSSVPGTVIQEVTVSNVTVTGFTVCVYRTNTSATTIQWMAAGTPK